MKRLAYLASVVLAGCNATMPTQATDPSKDCFARVATNPQFSGIFQKIGIPGGPPPTLEMLSSREKPTEEEKSALNLYQSTRESCYPIGDDFRQKNRPAWFNSMIHEQRLAAQNAIAKLYRGEFTYGEYLMDRNRREAEATEKSARYSQNDQAVNRAAQAQREQQNAIDTANTLRLMNALQPQAPSMPFPQRQQCDTRYVYGTYRTQCY